MEVSGSYSTRIVFVTFYFMFAVFVKAQTISLGVSTGYNGGPSLKINGMISNFAREFPLKIKMGIGYIHVNPGDPLAARRIFINNATNGTPQKRGGIWDLRIDFLHSVDWFSLKQAYIYCGPRYSIFKGNFSYIGGNEDFTISCNQWGLGFGLENYFRINKHIDLVTTTGFDYFLSGELHGHDTTYRPDNIPINGRETFDYSNADDAINQPKYELKLMLGITYYFDQ
jgi:hypothetical protein